MTIVECHKSGAVKVETTSHINHLNVGLILSVKSTSRNNPAFQEENTRVGIMTLSHDELNYKT